MFKDILVKDYNQVFANSVLLLDGKPYYLYEFVGSHVQVLNIGKQEHEIIQFSPKNINIGIPKLGYFNYRGISVYIFRNPVRMFKAGISENNIKCINSGVSKKSRLLHERNADAVSSARSLKSKQLYNTFLGVYPSIQECINRFQDGEVEIAFDRQFSIDNECNIRFKGYNVGYYDKGIVFDDVVKEHLSLALPKHLKEYLK